MKQKYYQEEIGEGSIEIRKGGNVRKNASKGRKIKDRGGNKGPKREILCSREIMTTSNNS